MAEPAIKERPDQAYVGTRIVMPMSDFELRIPAMTAHVYEWLSSRNVRATGKPFSRYHVIDMPARMGVELGIPVDAPSADGPVQRSLLPAGRYAVLMYEGLKSGVPANKTPIDWIADCGEETVSHSSSLVRCSSHDTKRT